MASSQFTSVLIVVFLAFLSVFTSPSSGLRTFPASSSESVSLALYYESLCPYSASFIVDNLAKIFDNGLVDIIDLKLVPWGNARITGNTTFNCQHGPAECLLNTVEACAINVWPELNKHFAFINCVETLVKDHKYLQWETCFEKLGFETTAISSCYQGGHGEELELKYADETDSLRPPHEYVPWVVVDGKPLYEDYENFVSYVCKAYKGSSPPSACGDPSFSSILREKPDDNDISPVCYALKETAQPKPTLLKSLKLALGFWMREIKDTIM